MCKFFNSFADFQVCDFWTIVSFNWICCQLKYWPFFTTKDTLFFCYKVVSFYAILHNLRNFSYFFLFKSRDVCQLVKAWFIFFVWITSYHSMKQRFWFLCVLVIHEKWFELAKFVFLLKFSVVAWLKIVVFFPLHWCFLHGDISYLKNQFLRWIRFRVVSGILSALFCSVVWCSFSFYILL